MGDLNSTERQMALGSSVSLQPRPRSQVKDYIVTLGIQAFCGKHSSLTAAVAAEIPLGYAAVRFLWLRALQAVGRDAIVARSAFGYMFLCHLGDLAEYPYYHPWAYRRELILCAQWLDGLEHPVVYDVGANSGFFVTQLAQMTAATAPLFYAFEAVPDTFSKLVASIQCLGLDRSIRPVAAAVLDGAREVRLKFNRQNSLLGQMVADDDEVQSTDTVTSEGITLDAFYEATGKSPCLLKVDVEGWEPAVFRGAGNLLSRHRPVILFEHNPGRGCGETAALFRGGPLDGYQLFYVDDLQGQVRAFGSAVDDIGSVCWICNLFAVPEERRDRWADTIDHARRRI